MAVQIFTEENFNDSIANGVVLVDFWAEWCGPCQWMLPILDDLSEELDGKVVVGKVNVDEAQSIAQQFRVMSIPTFIVFKDGQPVEQVVGSQTKEDLTEMITKHI